MAYTQTSANYLAFFTPNGADLLDIIDLNNPSLNGDYGELICMKPCKVKRLMFTVTDEAVVAPSGSPTVTFTKRPIPKSATNQVVIDTLVIPNGITPGKTIYLDIEPIEFQIGQSMRISLDALGISITGKGVFGFICDEMPEVAENNTNMIVSA